MVQICEAWSGHTASEIAGRLCGYNASRWQTSRGKNSTLTGVLRQRQLRCMRVATAMGAGSPGTLCVVYSRDARVMSARYDSLTRPCIPLDVETWCRAWQADRQGCSTAVGFQREQMRLALFGCRSGKMIAEQLLLEGVVCGRGMSHEGSGILRGFLALRTFAPRFFPGVC